MVGREYSRKGKGQGRLGAVMCCASKARLRDSFKRVAGRSPFC